jgi:hypothetical protein
VWHRLDIKPGERPSATGSAGGCGYRLLVEGREEQYLGHFFRDFAYNPTAMPESEVQ